MDAGGANQFRDSIIRPNSRGLGSGDQTMLALLGFRLLRQAGVAGNLATDAHLAALAIERQARVASTDGDFARFDGLRWFDPFARPRKRR